jgi:hypothetical protein
MGPSRSLNTQCYCSATAVSVVMLGHLGTDISLVVVVLPYVERFMPHVGGPLLKNTVVATIENTYKYVQITRV